MRSAVLILACVLVACSDAPEADGKQPEGVGDGGSVRDDAPQEVRDAIEKLEDENADPRACDYFAAAMVAWICIGTDPGIESPILLVDLGGEYSGGCIPPVTGFETIAPLCEASGADDAALYCAAYAATREAFVCCLEGTPLYGSLQSDLVCD